MPVFEWDKNYELGIDEFDEHHKQLVGLLNETYDTFTGGERHETFGEILDRLIDYATYHFAAEERWMGLNGYGGLQKHRMEHDEFSRRVVEIQDAFLKAKKHLPIETLVLLKEWLLDHILKEDADYGRFAAQSRNV
ncbi:MAG: hemerythrin family protein [Desulfuromonadales bacterium]|nr:hemerythrin family protein [Desulfuromonadales bacterium]